MNEFDLKAAGWDQNAMHWDRSVAIVKELLKRMPVRKEMTAMEFGAGTGITSFLLKDHLKEITMLDSSAEMVKVMHDKVKVANTLNLKPLLFDLEKEEWTGDRFDLLITQMVLHHVIDLGNIFTKFYKIINPGGYLAIADLYSEDGSFHGEGFAGHKGFDIETLADRLREHGFGNISGRKCFAINKKITETESRQFDVFLLIAFRGPDS
ncbi:MAG: class I SAM-dependent methyltransferase [Bacteroidia bacterium]|nr:class I SAM-dependent methyltransferase [Bacteroidia bacterium]